MSAEARINQRWASDEIQIRTDRGFVSSEFDVRSIHETDEPKLMRVAPVSLATFRAMTSHLPAGVRDEEKRELAVQIHEAMRAGKVFVANRAQPLANDPVNTV